MLGWVRSTTPSFSTSTAVITAVGEVSIKLRGVISLSRHMAFFISEPVGALVVAETVVVATALATAIVALGVAAVVAIVVAVVVAVVVVAVVVVVAMVVIVSVTVSSMESYLIPL